MGVKKFLREMLGATFEIPSYDKEKKAKFDHGYKAGNHSAKHAQDIKHSAIIMTKRIQKNFYEHPKDFGWGIGYLVGLILDRIQEALTDEHVYRQMEYCINHLKRLEMFDTKEIMNDLKSVRNGRFAPEIKDRLNHLISLC